MTTEMLFEELNEVSNIFFQDANELPTVDNFCLVFQPIVDVKSGKITAAEALLRLVDNNGKKLTPAEFNFSLSEYAPDLSLITWLVSQGLESQKYLKDNGINITIHINLQPGELLNQQFTQLAESMVTDAAKLGVRPLAFELVESSELVNIVRATTIMDQCNAKGVEFALDDFGTSYSTLQQLRFLPAQTIKLDKSFVMNIIASDEDLRFVKEMIEFCHRLDRKVVCEGVCETQIGRMLQYLDCDLLQGYAISKPLDLDDFISWHDLVHSGATWWAK